MKARCCYIDSHNYNNYGGKGVIVCDRWKDSFENFLEDMGERPSKEYTIHRKNNQLGYFPENCEWANKKVQSNNASYNRLITYNNETMTLSYWADRIGMPATTLRGRLENGWTLEQAISKPTRKYIKKQ